MKWYEIKAADTGPAEVRIFGEIGWEVTASQFIEDLDALGDRDIDLRISSVGGSVIEGIHIYNRLRLHKGEVRGTIEGLAASMASVIAMACDHVAMMPGWFMIHNPSGAAWGESKDHRKAAEILDKMRETLVTAYVSKTGMDSDEIGALMDAETWMNEVEALEGGFVDDVLEIDDELDMAATIRSINWDRANFSQIPLAVLAAATEPEPVKKMTRQEIIEEDLNDFSKAVKPASIGDGMKTPEQIAAEKAALAEAKEAGRMAEVQRRNDITDVFSGFEAHDAVMQKCLENVECTAEDARAKLLESLKKHNEDVDPQGGVVVVTEDSRDKFRAGALHALKVRAGIEKDDEKNEFRGLSLRELARECANRAGVSANRMRPLEYVGAAFSHGTSDFPYLLENVMHKTLMDAYMEWPTTYEMWSERGMVSDFKINSRVKLGSFNNIETVPENGEFKEGTWSEEKETIQAVTKGRIISLTRQGIINDDLGGFTRIARDLGRAARRTVNADAYGVITANGNMADGVALFDNGHSNLAGSGAAISSTTLSAAKAAMRKQKFNTTDDAYLDIRPDILLVPVALEDTAREIITSSTKDGQSNSRTPNIHQNSLTVVADPLLDADSTTAWYLLSSSDPIVEVAFLDGVDTPFLDSEEGFTIDGVRWKVRLDYAYDSIDWRGAYKNPGA